MNKEEILNKYIDLIDKGYCCACNELNCIDNFPLAKITHAIRELQQENSRLKEELEELKHKHYLIQGGRGNGKTYLLHLQQENKKLKEVIDKSIEKLEEVKERRIMLLDEEKVLEILKEVE